MSAFTKMYPGGKVESDLEAFKALTHDRKLLTPDFDALKLSARLHPVFTYGTLKMGRGNYKRFLEGASICAGKAYTATAGYEMRTTGHFPVVLQIDGKAERSHHIYGELFYVPLNTLCELDHLEANGRMYQRVMKPVFCLDQFVEGQGGAKMHPYMPAWMYIGVPKYWEEMKSQYGSKLNHLFPRRIANKDMYCF